MRTAAAAAKTSGDGWPDEAWAKKHPQLVIWLSDDRWDDGTTRELSSLSLKYQEGMVLASLNDQDGKRTLYKAAGSVAEAIQAIEKALQTGNAEWRSWNHRTKKK